MLGQKLEGKWSFHWRKRLTLGDVMGRPSCLRPTGCCGDSWGRSITGPRKCLRQTHHHLCWALSLGSRSHPTWSPLRLLTVQPVEVLRLGSGLPLCPVQSWKGIIVTLHSLLKSREAGNSQSTALTGVNCVSVDSSSQPVHLPAKYPRTSSLV